MAAIETIGTLIADDFTVWVHCENQFCRHHAILDLHALAARLGMDFVCIGKPNPLLAKLRCSECGSKDLGLTIQPVTGYTYGPPPADLPFGEPRHDRPPVRGRRARRRVRL